MKPVTQHNAGITLLEVMILMAILAVVAAVVILPNMTRRKVRSGRITCVNNLKQVGLAVRQWGMDHQDKYPMHVPFAQGGTMDHPLIFRAYVHFLPLSNELNTPKVLVCPDDANRVVAAAFDRSLDNRSLSYFMGAEADEMKPNVILSGDRNLTSNRVAVRSGLYALSTNGVVGWTEGIHNQCGNIGLSDGSVQQMTVKALQQHLLDYPQTNRLVMP